MNANTKAQQLYHLLSRLVETIVIFILIASTSLIVVNVLAQSKSKGGRSSKIPAARVTDIDLALAAGAKLQDLTATEAPELMEALSKAAEIDYQVENIPDCPITITSGRIKGLKIDWRFKPPSSVGNSDWSSSYLIIKDTVTLKNNTDRPIAGFSLSPGGYRPVAIPPNGVVTEVLTDHYIVWWEWDPDVEVAGVDFKDGKVWGRSGESYRLPPPPPLPPPPVRPRVVPRRMVKVIPVAVAPEIGLIRSSEQELRASAVNPIGSNKGQGVKGVGDAATVQLIIAPTGRVVCVIYLSGPESMRQSVVQAASQWRFRPTPGKAVAGVITVKTH